jgi:hypothetical protein
MDRKEIEFDLDPTTNNTYRFQVRGTGDKTTGLLYMQKPVFCLRGRKKLAEFQKGNDRDSYLKNQVPLHQKCTPST